AEVDLVLERITEAMTEAESIVNGYLAKRGYGLPLSPVPGLVTGWVRDIGRYLLHKDRISDDKDAILRNYKDALKFLQMVADGTFSLGAEDPIANNPMLADVRFDADENVFNRQQLRSFR
ncbi:TPA: gp436 family protein, partial [Pseudomonas aeruginosa]